jgi:hypothetical protein
MARSAGQRTLNLKPMYNLSSGGITPEMGLLHKLAGLVVEFPDDAHKQAPPPGGDEDVVSAIEKVRAELETEMKPKFEAAPPATPPAVATAGKPAGGAVAGDQIPLPLPLSIEELYKKANLAPDPQGFDVYKVEAMLADPEMADLTTEMRARMVKMTLKNMGRELRDVLADAARRDQALDQYLGFLRDAISQVGDQVAAANARHKQELDDYVAAKQAAIAANLAKLKTAQQTLGDFTRTKQAEEERLFRTVAPFVAPGENPVVVSEPPASGRPLSGGGKPAKEEK